MFSGGEITFVRYQDQKQTVGDVVETKDNVAQENELVFRKDDGTTVRGHDLKDEQMIRVDGQQIAYGAFKQAALGKDGKAIKALKATEMAKKFGLSLKSEGAQVFSNIKDLKNAIASGAADTVTLTDTDGNPLVVAKKDFQTKLTEHKTLLSKLITQIQQANKIAGIATTDGIDTAWTEVAGAQSGAKAGKAVAQPDDGSKKPASSFAYQMASPGAGAKASGSYYGATPNSGTPAMFQSMPAFTPSSYAAGLYVDSAISDGIGQLGKSRAEGQKLMMLFMYYARMAMSGDLGAMYQLIQFINYIIAKDKARQNIHISSKLIQLQDMSRKATEVLMSTPTEGKSDKEINEFTKALHKAKSQESTISTSQKLLADMLQEFAHVTEAMTNSTKALLDAWGRNMRTATRA